MLDLMAKQGKLLELWEIVEANPNWIFTRDPWGNFPIDYATNPTMRAYLVTKRQEFLAQRR